MLQTTEKHDGSIADINTKLNTVEGQVNEVAPQLNFAHQDTTHVILRYLQFGATQDSLKSDNQVIDTAEP